MTVAEFWEERYAASQVWSGRANRVLVDVAGELSPGRALDLGCGEGGDALWLARHGWQVTAVDISSTAIERGRQAAAAEGLADRTRWVAHDLADWTPDDEFDLVSAFFLQSPVHLPRASILRLASAAVAPGGHLLVVSHAAPPPWASGLHGHDHAFPTPEQEVGDLELTGPDWEVVAAEVRSREATGPDGRQAVLDDSVVFARRRPAEGRRVEAELRRLEPIFHRSPAGSGRAVFEAMTAPDYWEVGASGRVYEREFVLSTVADRYARDEPEGGLSVSDFAVRHLDGQAWLATYALDQDGRASRRATIWTDTGDGWVAVYHQGTLA